jgi:hypothetical protein
MQFGWPSAYGQEDHEVLQDKKINTIKKKIRWESRRARDLRLA